MVDSFEVAAFSPKPYASSPRVSGGTDGVWLVSSAGISLGVCVGGWEMIISWGKSRN